MKTLLAFVALLLASVSVQASKHRAVWFWKSADSPYGATNIVGNNTLENQTIAFFNSKSIKRVYGSYGSQPETDPGAAATWNTKLQSAGIQSQFLMSENTWIFVTNRPGLLTKITDRVISFNGAPGRLASERFDALHLDIEPQALPEWSGLTPAQKRDHLNLLRDTYADVRQHFVNAGLPSFPVYADLPVWFDNLPTDGGSVGWTGAVERDQWFTDVATSLAGITLMPFDRLTFSSIDNGVSWERVNIAGATVRVGLEADIGTGLTWEAVPDFHAMMETLESSYGASGAVDIQSYALWREALAAQPIIAVAAALQKIQLPNQGELVFDTETHWTYLIHHTTDLCAWREILRVRSVEPGRERYPVEFNAPQGFWRVSRFQASQE